MSRQSYIIAIDQGTSSTKAVIFDSRGSITVKTSAPLESFFPHEGFVEQDPGAIISSVREAVSECLSIFRKDHPEGAVATAGISNQRETFLLWDRNGEPITNAIVWQCKRSISICEELKQNGYEELIQSRTGLLIDPYFSGTKLIWLYRNNPAAREKIDSGEAYFGTIDTWLLYNLTSGKVYKTDHTNASRTMLFNLTSLEWDREILREFSLSNLNLPEISPSSSLFGATDLFGALPGKVLVESMIGDSQSAAFGENIFHRGDVKATLGTGSSVLINVGSNPAASSTGMVSTVCFSTGNRVDYGLEGIIVSCGSTITWLKSQLRLFDDEQELSASAAALQGNNGVYFIPAFSGIGAPHWKMDARAAIMGLTFGTGYREVARAALESIGYQLKDVLVAMQADSNVSFQSVRLDGGIIKNGFVMQHIANLLEIPVATIGMQEVSALGAAFLAGLSHSLFSDIEKLSELHTGKSMFYPDDGVAQTRSAYLGWKNYLERLL